MPVLTKGELVAPMQRSGRIITAIVAFTFTPQLHGGRLTLLSLSTGFTATLPAAIGSGVIYAVEVGIVLASNTYVVQVANASDTMKGTVSTTGGTADRCEGFAAAAASDTFTINATTQGGLNIIGIVIAHGRDTPCGIDQAPHDGGTGYQVSIMFGVG